MPSQESRDVADIHQRLDSITRQIEQISQPAPRNDAPRGEAPRGRADRRPAVERRHLAPRCAAVADFEPGPGTPGPRCRTGSARAEMVERAAAAGLSSLAAAEPGLVRFRDRRNRRAPERTRRPAGPADAAAQRAADAQPTPSAAPVTPTAPPVASYAPPMPQPAPAAPAGSGFLRRWNVICSRSRARSRRCSVPTTSSNRSRHSAASSPKSVLAITEAMPRRAIEFDRERNPLAVAPHRRHPPERHRRPDAGRHRARARRNPRGAALADAGRATRRL